MFAKTSGFARVTHVLEHHWLQNTFGDGKECNPNFIDGAIYPIAQLGMIGPEEERGVFGVSMDQIMRLRHNPFFPYLRARLEAMIDAL